MDNKIIESNSDQEFQEEIPKIVLKIIKRYKLEPQLANKVAIELYKNGIKSDKFQEKYYQEEYFDLNEIVLYIIKKITTKEINYKSFIFSHPKYFGKMRFSPIEETGEQAEIININSIKRKKIKQIKSK